MTSLIVAAIAKNNIPDLKEALQILKKEGDIVSELNRPIKLRNGKATLLDIAVEEKVSPEFISILTTAGAKQYINRSAARVHMLTSNNRSRLKKLVSKTRSKTRSKSRSKTQSLRR